MKLYRNKDGVFTPTQEQAKQRKREGFGAFEQVEVPTSDGREALAEYLNALVAAGSPNPSEPAAAIPDEEDGGGDYSESEAAQYAREAGPSYRLPNHG